MIHSKYWSCSKFADFVRGTPKIPHGTAKEWREWDEQAKAAHPFRFWLAEEFLSDVQDIVFWPRQQYINVKNYIYNIFVFSHALNSRLEVGKWYEYQTRVLHSLMDSFVDFVEIDIAWHSIWCQEDLRKKYDKWYNTFPRLKRLPEVGIEHLEWASTLVYDESCGVQPSQLIYGMLTDQARAAQEMLEIYDWWVNKRPNRPDPYDISGWSKLCENQREQQGKWYVDLGDSVEVRQSLNMLNNTEEAYDEEDEDMLIRLIKIRKELWT